MPYKAKKIGIRIIDPYDDVQLEQLKVRPEIENFLHQSPVTTLPLFLEDDYATKNYHNWAKDFLKKEGHNPEEINFRYAIIDYEFEPIDKSGKNLSFPALVASMFDYNGKTYLGPFVGGHLAGLSMVQSLNEEKYAKFTLDEKHSHFFSAELQQDMIRSTLQAIIDHPQVNGLIVAIPNRGYEAETFLKSPIARLLSGGNLMDSITTDTLTKVDGGIDGSPIQIRETAYTYGEKNAPQYLKDFTYYSFLPENERNELLSDQKVLQLIDAIRRAGPAYKSAFPQQSSPIGFNPNTNIQLMQAIVRNSTDKIQI